MNHYQTGWGVVAQGEVRLLVQVQVQVQVQVVAQRGPPAELAAQPAEPNSWLQRQLSWMAPGLAVSV
jgi:hypothetical protein